MSEKAPWLTFRPELKVLDCTIRDGGLMNNSRFSDEEVRAVYRACLEAGIDYMEIGYLNSTKVYPPTEYGPWRHCREEDMRRVVGEHKSSETGLRLCAMADAGGKSDWQKYSLRREESVLDAIRVACYARQISEAAEMISHFHSLGYETWLNVMAISTVKEDEMDQVLEIAAQTPVDVVVVVDSYGALYREQIDHIVKKYLNVMREVGKEVGIHAHNNLQLAFANSIEAIILGCNRIDATFLGLGRGAGNCPMEILLSFLRNPKFKLRPVLEVIRDTIQPMRKRFHWGPSVPYVLTGALNLHPRDAMEFCEKDPFGDIVGFYDELVEED
ncbi:MAG: aldolase catalytic domain-containing protein [Chthoniobacterales bacterium]|nr:aldolase catalytic domain-containing protein [Chthoniobacterales bacterium]